MKKSFPEKYNTKLETAQFYERPAMPAKIALHRMIVSEGRSNFPLQRKFQPAKSIQKFFMIFSLNGASIAMSAAKRSRRIIYNMDRPLSNQTTISTSD